MINSPLPKVTNHVTKNKYIYLLTIICLLQILLAGQADLTNYDPNHDVISYRKMAIAFPSIDYSVGKPFAHRLLAPWLVGFFFNDVDLGFILFNALFSAIFTLTLFYFLQQNRISDRIAFFITAVFIFNRYFIPGFAYEPYRFADVLSNLMLLLSLIFTVKRKYLLVLILSVVGVLARESAIAIIPVGLVFILFINQKKELLKFVFISAILIAVFILIRVLLPVELGISLSQAFAENWTKIFSPEAIAKQFFLAFNPLYLIPLFSYKEFFAFNKNNLYWLVLLIFVIFASLFGGDKERLMFAYVPIYYLFIAILFQRLDNQIKINLPIFFSLLVLSWIVNLHHIWGMIKLPSREISLAFAFAGGIIMLIIYLRLIKDRKSIN